MQVYRTNFLVADSTWRLAGRVAFIGKCSDGYVLYDWKRRNGITDKYGNAITENAFDQKGTNGLENIWDTPFWHYALQLNLYRAILEKNHHLKICSIYLIDISPQRDNFAKIPIPLLDNELKAALEFLACRTILPFRAFNTHLFLRCLFRLCLGFLRVCYYLFHFFEFAAHIKRKINII